MQAILFLCTQNAARSQLAEAIVKHYFSDQFQAFSAGTQPSSVNQDALSILQQQNIATDKLFSKDLQQLPIEQFDFIITLCNRARQECVDLPSSHALLHWNIDDPISGNLNSFQQVYLEIYKRITRFCRIQLAAIHSISLDPIALFKLLSDNTRLQIIMLIEDEQELSVGELSFALNESQPKISRHLALLREAQLLSTTRQAQHIYYHLPEALAPWVKQVIASTRMANPAYINLPLLRLREQRYAIQK